MLVVGCDCRVVVPGDARNAVRSQQRDRFVRPGRITDQIAEMIDGVDATAPIDVGKHRFQRGKIRVDVREQGKFHGGSVGRWVSYSTLVRSRRPPSGSRAWSL